jgi:signal transduction histidine kinase
MPDPLAAPGGLSRTPLSPVGGLPHAAARDSAPPLRLLPLDGSDQADEHADVGGRSLPSLASTLRPGAVRARKPHPSGRLAAVGSRALERLRSRFSKLSAELGRLDGGGLSDRGDAAILRRLAADLQGLAETLVHLGDLVESSAPLPAAAAAPVTTASAGMVLEAVVSEAAAFHDGAVPRFVVDAGGDDRVAAPTATLVRILRTLVRNAIDAAGPEGEVVLTSVAYDDAVEIEVADSGRGLSGHARAWLFEPGFSTKTDGEGLALAAAGCLADRLGGGIDVINCPDGGTAFILRLPRPSAIPRAA